MNTRWSMNPFSRNLAIILLAASLVSLIVAALPDSDLAVADPVPAHVHMPDGRACWYVSQGPQPEPHAPRELECTDPVVMP